MKFTVAGFAVVGLCKDIEENILFSDHVTSFHNRISQDGSPEMSLPSLAEAPESSKCDFQDGCI